MDDRTPAAIGRLAHARALKELAGSLRENRAATASGLWGSSVAAVTAAIENELHRPILLICGHIDEADDLADDLELFHNRRPDILPALELSGSLGQISEEQASNRLQLICRLAAQSSAASAPRTTPRHSERSEESRPPGTEILRSAQDDANASGPRATTNKQTATRALA